MSFHGKIPLQPIQNELTAQYAVNLYVLRLDRIDAYAGGNKFFKLKYNLEEIKRAGHRQVITFGGAWSNHLAAIAASWQKAEGSMQKVIAVVRGEEPINLSDTLRFCKEKGVELHFVSREEYRKKESPGFLEKIREKFGDFYLLPEGGSNELAVQGCREIVDLIDIDFDLICCPVGSGGTIAGIASGLKSEQTALGFVALKGGEYLEEVITKLIRPPRPATLGHSPTGEKIAMFKLHLNYHFGGFAKTTPELLRFKKQFEKEQGFELDYIYTSKMFYGIFDLMKQGYFASGSKIVAIHTGGLQGNKGFE